MSSYSAMGTPMRYNFDPMMGQPLQPLVPSSYSFLSQPLRASFSTPISPNVAGLSALSGLSEEEHPLVVGSHVPLIPSGSRWDDTYCDCLLVCGRDDSVSLIYNGS